MSYFLRTPVEFRNLIPGMTGVIPGLPPGVAPPGGGAPTLPGGGAPTLPGGGAPTLPGGGAPTLPGGGQPPKTSGPGIPPGAGPGPGIGQPGLGQPGVTPKLDPNAAHIDLGLDGKVIALAVDLRWSKANYETINPVVLKIINGLKARIIMHTSNVPFQGLSAAIKKHVAEKGGFPRGTAERPKDDPARRGMAYPPSTRVSFYPELLPYLNRDYHLSINPQAAWYDPENLPAAEAWVPEFLAPSYPSSSWRATSLTYVPDGRSLGATNYVAIAGVGVDAARYTLPENAKKMGLVGYEWGSKVEEVTDGLANTIFLMQTPPGVPQPWLQGGGATIRGLSEADPMQGFRHTFPNGQQGTYALMGDGSTRFIKGNINPEVLKAMATRRRRVGVAGKRNRCGSAADRQAEGGGGGTETRTQARRSQDAHARQARRSHQGGRGQEAGHSAGRGQETRRAVAGEKGFQTRNRPRTAGETLTLKSNTAKINSISREARRVSEGRFPSLTRRASR